MYIQVHVCVFRTDTKIFNNLNSNLALALEVSEKDQVEGAT